MIAVRRRVCRAASGGRHDETGSTSVELVVVLPALFSLIFLGVQAGLYFHARQVVIAAANQGALAAAAEYGTASDGHEAATTFLDQTGDVALTGWSVNADRDLERAVVRVEAASYAVLPFLTPTVTAQASMPSETLRSAP